MKTREKAAPLEEAESDGSNLHFLEPNSDCSNQSHTYSLGRFLVGLYDSVSHAHNSHSRKQKTPQLASEGPQSHGMDRGRTLPRRVGRTTVQADVRTIVIALLKVTLSYSAITVNLCPRSGRRHRRTLGWGQESERLWSTSQQAS